MTSTPALAFVDTETTGLDPFLHEAWEIAIILRVEGADTEHTFRVEPDLTNANSRALEINRYQERTSADDWKWDNPQTAAVRIHHLLDGAVMVGSNPAFDAAMITRLFGMHHPNWQANPTPWHYRQIDIATLAAGALYGRAAELTRRDFDADWYRKVTNALGWPWKSYDASEHVGVERPKGDYAHTALGDARWARDVYDAVTIPDAFYAASDEELGRMASEALSRRDGAA